MSVKVNEEDTNVYIGEDFVPKIRKSPFTGVCWDKTSARWKGQITLKQKKYYCGHFLDQVSCALAVNELCHKLKISVKNRELLMDGTNDSTSFTPRPEVMKILKQSFFKDNVKKKPQVGKKYGSSKFIGVSWNKRQKKWTTQICRGSEKYHAGYYKSEIEAAIAVNKKCMELGIRVKNPDLSRKSKKIKEIPVSKKPSPPRKRNILETKGTKNNIPKHPHWKPEAEISASPLENAVVRTKRKFPHCEPSRQKPPVKRRKLSNDNSSNLPFSRPSSPDVGPVSTGAYFNVATAQWEAKVYDHNLRKNLTLGFYREEKHALESIKVWQLAKQKKIENEKCNNQSNMKKNRSSCSSLGKIPKKETQRKKNDKSNIKTNSNKNKSPKQNRIESNILDSKDKIENFDIETDSDSSEISIDEDIEIHLSKKKSRFAGVSWDDFRNKWEANVIQNGKKIKVGLFVNEECAARAVNEKCRELGIQILNKNVSRKCSPSPNINSKKKIISSKAKSAKLNNNSNTNHNSRNKENVLLKDESDEKIEFEDVDNRETIGSLKLLNNSLEKIIASMRNELNENKRHVQILQENKNIISRRAQGVFKSYEVLKKKYIESQQIQERLRQQNCALASQMNHFKSKNEQLTRQNLSLQKQLGFRKLLNSADTNELFPDMSFWNNNDE